MMTAEMRKQIGKEVKMSETLAKDHFDWKDMVIFALDDHLVEMIKEMISMGEFSDLSEDEVHEMADYIENRTRKAIGKPLQRV